MEIIDELAPTFEKTESALEECRQTATSSPARKQAESVLCLSTRELFSDFHSLSLVRDQLDMRAWGRLDQVLRDAIQELEKSGKTDIVAAVTQRRADFLRFCAIMVSGDEFVEQVIKQAASRSRLLEPTNHS